MPHGGDVVRGARQAGGELAVHHAHRGADARQHGAGGYHHQHQGVRVAAQPGEQHQQRFVRPVLRPLHVQQERDAGAQPPGAGVLAGQGAAVRQAAHADQGRHLRHRRKLAGATQGGVGKGGRDHERAGV